MPWPVVFDGDGSLAALYGIAFGAGIVFIDREGIIRGRYVSSFSKEELIKKIESIL